MSVFKPKGARTYVYDFVYQGVQYKKSTKQTRRDLALKVEEKLKEELRQRAAGIYIPQRDDSPRIQEWSEVFYNYKATRLARPEALGDILPVALRFWGSPKGVPPTDAAPCYDLRLCDPIRDPEWIVKWEQWLATRVTRQGAGPAHVLSNQSKNHYRGLMRRMYAVALLPEYRAKTGVMLNPFVGVPNEPTLERTVTLEPKELERWIRAASYHVRLAVGIAALAPKLRLRNVLDLQWGEHFRPDPRATKFSPKHEYFIEVAQHKTARKTKRPLVVPVSAQLLRILKDAWQRRPHVHVVTFRGGPVKGIRDGVAAAVTGAKLTYGRDVADGVTFHTIRHSAATLISQDQEDPLKLRDAMGHGDLRTTLKYRHMRPARQRPTLERLSRRLKIEKAITEPPARARRKVS